MKRTIVLVMVITMLATALLGCGGAPTQSAQPAAEAAADTPATTAEATTDATEKPLIGVIVHNINDKWVSYLAAGFRAALEDRADAYQYQILDCASDVNKESGYIDTLIEMKAAGIILHCVDSNACSAYISKCKEAGIPLMITKNVYSEQLPDAYTGTDNFADGVAEAEALISVMGESGKVVRLLGEIGSEYTVMRNKGNDDVFAKYPGISVVHEELASWDRNKAITVVENLLSSGLEFNAICANNDEMAIGAAIAIQNYGKDLKDYYIVGIDATPDGLDALEQGLMDATVCDDAVELAARAVERMDQLIKGETVAYEYLIDSMPVTKENLQEIRDLWASVS